MFRVLTRATLMVIAPSAPVAWSPGTPPLTESLRARVMAGAATAAERAIEVLPVSGRRVVAVPVDTAMRWIIGTQAGADDRRVAIPIRGELRAPWGEPDAVPGVVMRTSAVPTGWLRPPVAPRHATPVAAAIVEDPRPEVPRPTAGHHPTPRREPHPMPASVRVRKAAMMAFGLLVSLVAVEAAARVGRR
ncbi:MAG: hypothetical protein ABWZ82_00400 [Candidatus Limnocylindrales bacterium]